MARAGVWRRGVCELAPPETAIEMAKWGRSVPTPKHFQPKSNALSGVPATQG